MDYYNISIIVPFQSDHGLREKNWNWIKSRYEVLMPGAEICIGDKITIPYSKAAAINHAVRKCTRPILIIADADVFFDLTTLHQSLELLENASMVIPFKRVLKLNPILSDQITSSQPSLSLNDLILQRDYAPSSILQNAVGGINIIRRDTYRDSGGFDERFKGWGGEDDAFHLLISNLYGSNQVRALNDTIWHLHHAHTPLINTHYKNNVYMLNVAYNTLQTIKLTQCYLRRTNKF